ncbi:guanylate-binding protein 1-like [Engraulis encrasicolus]|uniref:guanylate-binding protein 1-like n=1 Tax=Engraulis encrasicolus TaxID=184585 RepID=UPI002FCF8290
MEEPVCLIDTGPDGRLSVQQGALQILEHSQELVVVVAVVGLYRTGKSFLMNRLAGKRKGFALGSTVESKTKGIWMWCIPHPIKDGHTLVLLDTEGLGDVEKGDEKHDTRIFCLAVLLSSTLVYNSMITIDNNALEKLHLVTELTEHIRVKSTEDSENTELKLKRFFPSFVWTVRDFMLELELKGKPISADEYLENSLEQKEGSKPEVNKVRQSLKEFFVVRRCFVMERPASKQKMKRVEQLTDDDLDESFVEQANEFCNYIHHEAQVKTMRGDQKLTGRMLGSLVESSVEAIRSGKMPCLENAVVSLAKIHNGRALAEALELYEKEMIEKVEFPTETQEALYKVHREAVPKAISKFMKASFNSHDGKHLLLLRANIEGKYVELYERNVKESGNQSKKVIRDVFASLLNGLNSGSFVKPGGYNKFRSELDRGVECYRSTTGKGFMSEEVLTDYLEEKHVVGNSIMIADESLTESQRKAEEQRIRREEAEQQQRLLQQKLEMEKEAMHEMKKNQEESIKQLEMNMEEEKQRAREEDQQALESKLKEQKEHLQHRFEQANADLKEKCTQLETEIAQLEKESTQLKKKTTQLKRKRDRSKPFEAVGRLFISQLYQRMSFADDTEMIASPWDEAEDYSDVQEAAFQGPSHRTVFGRASRAKRLPRGMSSKDLLFRVRSSLIQRMTYLSPILDCLLRANVINQEEYANVLAWDTSQDKVRSLLDMIYRKGEMACKIMLQVLQELDPYLYEDLLSTLDL